MAVFKCKMCGGSLAIGEDITIAECEYCGSKQTVPSRKDEIITNLFNRANNLRLKSEFDKAAEVYNKILNENDHDAEAHWGLVLCKYGIEYVDDPKTYARIPTCHRTQYTSVLSDADYLAAIENADILSKEIYTSEALRIAELQKAILAIVKDEKPFDVFICYKETDENGRRTVDSALANDIYYQLTKEGLRVFYSAITLEDKLGIEYEPYIFAALNSAKVMLAIGTKPEYFNAVWVKNEWSRYLGIMKTDREKILIPCYRDLDAYDLPEEFAHFQAQNMSKIGFINDLVRGIKKVVDKEETEAVVNKETAVSDGSANAASLLKRALIFLEDGDFSLAKEYFERVLDIDPECAEAYLGSAMAEERVNIIGDLVLRNRINNKNYVRARRFADKELLEKLDGFEKLLEEKIKQAEEERIRKEKEAEEERIRKEKEAEEERIRKEKEAEEERIRREKEAEEEQIRKKRAKEEARKATEVKKMLASGEYHTAGLKTDGTVTVVGDNDYGQCNVDKWTDIASVSAGSSHTVGLKSDGKVVAVGYNIHGQCNVDRWTDIISVSAGGLHTVGLKADGTVAAVGSNLIDQCNVDRWTDIISVSAGSLHTVGLKSDRKVVAVGENEYGQCNVDRWTDIVSVSAGWRHTVGLKSNGTVVAVGENKYDQCNVSRWTDIISVSAGWRHTVGLKSDGTVVAIGDNEDGQCNVNKWTGIASVRAGSDCTLGLKTDGTVVAVGRNDNNHRIVATWKLFDTLDNIEEERKVKQKEMRLLNEKKAVLRSQNLCQYCGGTFKGIFTKKCTACGREKDY